VCSSDLTKLFEEGGHRQFIITPDEKVSEVIAMCFLYEAIQVKKVTLSSLFAVAGFVNCLNALERQGRGREFYWPSVAVFIVFPLPDQFCLQARERMKILRSPIGRIILAIAHDRASSLDDRKISPKNQLISLVFYEKRRK
jgi:hypothetical protein